MTDAPERIWAWVDGLAGIVGTAREPETPSGILPGPTAMTYFAEYVRADLAPRWSSDMEAAPRMTPVLGWHKEWPYPQVMIWCKSAHVPLCGWHGLPAVDEKDDMLRPRPSHWKPLDTPEHKGAPA